MHVVDHLFHLLAGAAFSTHWVRHDLVPSLFVRTFVVLHPAIDSGGHGLVHGLLNEFCLLEVQVGDWPKSRDYIASVLVFNFLLLLIDFLEVD